jgi:hypothetical protein
METPSLSREADIPASVLDRKYLDALQKAVVNTFCGDSRYLVDGDVYNSALVGIHEIQDLLAARFMDMLGDFLDVLFQLILLALPEKITVHLDFFRRQFVEKMLDGEEKSSVLAQKKLFVRAFEDDIEELALGPHMIAQLQGEHLEKPVQKFADWGIVGGPLRPGGDDDFFAFYAEELGFLGYDLIVELGAGEFEYMFGQTYGILEVSTLEFLFFLIRFMTFCVFFHGIHFSFFS